MTNAPGSLERVLFALAGTVSLLGVTLGVLVSPWFLLVTVFAALNQLLFATVGACPASMLLERVTPLQRGGRR